MEINPTDSLIIRPETAEDYDEIDELVVVAFEGRAELAPFVRAIRSSPNYAPEYSLIAEQDGRIIGHVMLSYVNLQDGNSEHKVLSLSPLSVIPDMQRKGIGSRLINQVITSADNNGEPLILLEGSPAYYPKFGFMPASNHNITFTLPEWAPPEAAMVKPLSNDDANLKGHLKYPPAFDLVSE